MIPITQAIVVHSSLTGLRDEASQARFHRMKKAEPSSAMPRVPHPRGCVREGDG
jgi:hypothetical protein